MTTHVLFDTETCLRRRVSYLSIVLKNSIANLITEYNLPTTHRGTSLIGLNVHPTGDQEVAGLTPAGSATFFRGD